jgi:hypothetical protein
MSLLSCHECAQTLTEGGEIWLSPETGRPDEDGGEPYCPGCACPMGIAA